MTRRFEAGPLIVTLGALLLLVSLFLDWFTGDVTAWEAFEVWDVGLFVLGLGAIAAGLGLAVQAAELVDRRFLVAAVAIIAVVVASQIVDPPPAAAGQDAETGAWLALGAAVVMCVGALLTFGRVHLALTVEGRDSRQRVPVVDARGPKDSAAKTSPAPGAPDERQSTAEARAFGGEAATGSDASGARAARQTEVTQPTEGAPEAGTEPREAKQD